METEEEEDTAAQARNRTVRAGGGGGREGLLMGGVGVESVFPECRRMWCWEGGVKEPSDSGDSDGCALSQHFSFFTV